MLRRMDGKTLASGELVQVVQGDRLVSNLVFHFKDGSIDDETTVFSQHHNFRLLSDHHVQKGPSFPHPMDVSIDASNGQVTVRSTDGGKEKVETERLDLPPDLANGLVPTFLKNIRPDVAETKVSYVAATPKPRLVKLAITPQGEQSFKVAGVRHKASSVLPCQSRCLMLSTCFDAAVPISSWSARRDFVCCCRTVSRIVMWNQSIRCSLLG